MQAKASRKAIALEKTTTLKPKFPKSQSLLIRKNPLFEIFNLIKLKPLGPTYGGYSVPNEMKMDIKPIWS